MNKKGMALVTLSITVVIIMILSLAVVTNLNNTRLIEKTEDIVDEYNLKNIEQAANMAYYNIYFENLTKGIRKEITSSELKSRMIKDGIKEEVLNNFDVIINNSDITINKKTN